jgi:hypothetical protein
MTYWTFTPQTTHEDDSVSGVLSVDATLTPGKKGWEGHITTLPFTELTATGATHNEARQKLAYAVLENIKAGGFPVSPKMITGVRVLSTSTSQHPRGGEFTGPVITIPAVADRAGETWQAATTTDAGLLHGYKGEAPTMAAARDALATTLMMELEMSGDEIAYNWSGIRLMTATRKTYDVSVLSG